MTAVSPLVSPRSPMAISTLGTPRASVLIFGLAQEFGGQCHLRFDDTNPVKEDVEYVESIKNDVLGLGLIGARIFILLRTILSKCISLQWSSSKKVWRM